VIQASDDRNAPQPLLLQGEDCTLGNSNGAVLAHRAEALLHVPLPQQPREDAADEDAFLVGDDVLGRSIAQEGALQRRLSATVGGGSRLLQGEVSCSPSSAGADN